jgi:hypothetical protein
VDISNLMLKALATAVAKAMRTFLADTSRSAMTYRVVRKAIRKLWQLASEADPPIGQIRALIKVLPEQVIRHFDYLARQEIPKFYSMGEFRRTMARDHMGMPAVEIEALENGGFRAWAAVANDRALMWAIQTLPVGVGVINVPGRSRGMGKRSRPRIEPILMGKAQGAAGQMLTSNQSHPGGRPSILYAHFSLIGKLVVAWERATSTLPSAGRSDETAFGELVHSVFQWLGMDGQAEYALREYWEEFSRS